MDEEEAQSVAEQRLAELRKLAYEQLLGYRTAVGEETIGPSGTWYQLEIQAFWDRGRRAGDLRVLVSIDDGGRRAYSPLTVGFIMRRDGTFVGE